MANATPHYDAALTATRVHAGEIASLAQRQAKPTTPTHALHVNEDGALVNEAGNVISPKREAAPHGRAT